MIVYILSVNLDGSGDNRNDYSRFFLPALIFTSQPFVFFFQAVVLKLYFSSA